MDFRIVGPESRKEVEHLFNSVFSESEGEQEGELIGCLASQLARRIDGEEIICVGAYDQGLLTGGIFFTRLCFDEPINAYMLAPVAVSTAHQGKGIGQALIGFGLNELKLRSVSLVVTYGDPAFYSKVGFQPLSEQDIQAPRTLSMPEGWLGQPLTATTMPVLTSRPECVHEFDNPDFW